MYKVPDRVIRNHNRLNNTVNLNEYFSSNYYESYHNNIFNICEKIDSLEIANDIKYVLALENTCHLFDINNKDYDIDLVLENVTDYFLYNNLYEEREELENILEKVSLKYKPDLSKVKELLKKFPEEKIKNSSTVKKIIKNLYSLSDKNIIEETPNFLVWIRKGLVFTTFAINPYIGALTIFIDYFIEMTVKRSEVKKMITKLESEKDKVEKKINSLKNSKVKSDHEKYLKEIKSNIDKLHNYEDSLYSEKELEERDDFEMNFESNNTFTKDEYYNYNHSKFIGEIVKVRNDIIKRSKSTLTKEMKQGVLVISTDEELNDFIEVDYVNLENYMDSYNRVSFCVAQILPYNYSEEKDIKIAMDFVEMLTDKLEEITDENVMVSWEGGDDIYNIFVYLLIPIKDVVQENTMNKELKKDLAIILAIEEQVNKMYKLDTEELINDLGTNINESVVLEFNEFTSQFPCIIYDNDKVLNILKNIKKSVYECTDYTDIEKSKVGSAIQESIYQLSKPKENTVFRPKNRYQVLAECVSMNNEYKIIQELSLGNSIKLAQQNLVKKTKNLSDKEKILSNQMDNALDKFYNKVEKELTNKNREKVIKGTILPSASSIVKLALASGVAYMINPALSVIGILGSIAMSKNGTRKEKQYILDEINIMLKLTEKKIQLAENNNDMKALEELLRTQQKLERERQRIYYNLRRRNQPVITSRKERE